MDEQKPKQTKIRKNALKKEEQLKEMKSILLDCMNLSSAKSDYERLFNKHYS